MKIRYYPPRRPGPPPTQLTEADLSGAKFGCFLVSILAVFGLVGTCTVAVFSSGPAPSSPPIPDQAPAPGNPGSIDSTLLPYEDAFKQCDTSSGAYDGFSCVPGGEQVAVTRVIDGDTFEIHDGRQIRLLAVDTPERGECGYNEATAFTRGLLEGQRVQLFREPGVTTDQYGRELAYVDDGGLYQTVQDVGVDLAEAGHAELSPASDANAAYNARISTADATSTPGPCEQPPPTTDTYVPDYDYPNPGGGDDDESRFCRRKWYC